MVRKKTRRYGGSARPTTVMQPSLTLTHTHTHTYTHVDNLAIPCVSVERENQSVWTSKSFSLLSSTHTQTALAHCQTERPAVVSAASAAFRRRHCCGQQLSVLQPSPLRAVCAVALSSGGLLLFRPPFDNCKRCYSTLFLQFQIFNCYSIIFTRFSHFLTIKYRCE